MARHKIYASMRPYTNNGWGNAVYCGSRSVIKNVLIDVNADCNGKTDVEGKINVIHDNDTDKITVYVDCPSYNVIVLQSKNDFDIITQNRT